MTEMETNDGFTVLHRGEPSGAYGPVRCQYVVGQYLRNPDNRQQILAVVKESSRFISEDGMALGIGDHEGWLHTAYCREATAEETRSFIQEEQAERSEHETRLATLEAWQHIREILQDSGEQPWDSRGGEIALTVRQLLRSSLTAEGGEAFVIDQEDFLWHLRSDPPEPGAGFNARLDEVRATGFRIPLRDLLNRLNAREVRLLNLEQQQD